MEAENMLLVNLHTAQFIKWHFIPLNQIGSWKEEKDRIQM